MPIRTLGFVATTWLFAALALPCEPALAQGAENSYHGQLGFGTGTGMLERWSPLYNFSFEKQNGIDGWIQHKCDSCHIGAYWNPEQPFPNCFLCHNEPKFTVTDSGCLYCHDRGVSKRGDRFTPEADVHVAAGLACHDCHLRVTDEANDHQFLKGTAIDTTEPTMAGTLSCTEFCHQTLPHPGTREGKKLNDHLGKVACETCHTGKRPEPALAARRWNRFSRDGMVWTVRRAANWMPAHKWYDREGFYPSLKDDLPVLGHTERRKAIGAKIYPFNSVSVSWLVKSAASVPSDVIIVPEVRAADTDGDGTTTVAEMRAVYSGARLLTAEIDFSISHSVPPKALAFTCDDCHGRNGWVLDWAQLGYEHDPSANYRYRHRVGNPKPGN